METHDPKAIVDMEKLRTHHYTLNSLAERNEDVPFHADLSCLMF